MEVTKIAPRVWKVEDEQGEEYVIIKGNSLLCTCNGLAPKKQCPHRRAVVIYEKGIKEEKASVLEG